MGKIRALDYGTNGITLAVYSEDFMKSMTLKDVDGDDITPTVFVDGKTWGSHIYGKRAKEGIAVFPCIVSAKTHALEKEAFTKDGIKYDPAYVISNEVSHKISDTDEFEEEEAEGYVGTYPACMAQEGPEAVYQYTAILEKNTKPGGKDRVMMAMIPEPVAAALAEPNPDMKEQNRYVLDIGGGTADLCVVEIRNENGTTHILAHSVYGEKLGGDDWDALYYEFFKKQLIRQGISYENDLKLKKELYAKCEEIKINMSTRRDEKIEFDLFSNLNKKYVHFCITKAEYNQLLIQFWNEVKALLDKYTKMIDPMQIDNVLLVGGTCSNVILQKYLREYFSKSPYQHVKVIAHKEKTAVALGAANYAHWVFDEQKSIHVGVQKSQERKVQVELECTDSLGILCHTSAGEACIGNIIRKGKSFPCTDTRVFRIARDGQQRIPLKVYWNESEDTLVKLHEGTHIGEESIDISKIPVIKGQRVKVVFSMPSQGVVNAEVTLLDKNGQCQEYFQASNPFRFIRSKGA